MMAGRRRVIGLGLRGSLRFKRAATTGWEKSRAGFSAALCGVGCGSGGGDNEVGVGRAGFSGCPVPRWLGFKRQRQGGQPFHGVPSALRFGAGRGSGGRRQGGQLALGWPSALRLEDARGSGGSDNEVAAWLGGLCGCLVWRWLGFGRAAAKRSHWRGGGLGGCPVRVGCCCRAWGWARTRWGFELGGVARRRAGGAPFPPRPGHHRDGHLKNGGSPRSEGPTCVGCLGCLGFGCLLAGFGWGRLDRCRRCEAFSALGSRGSHGGEASGLFGGFGSRVEIGLHVLGPFGPVEPGREVVEVIGPVFGIHVGVGAPVRTPTPATAAAPDRPCRLGFRGRRGG